MTTVVCDSKVILNFVEAKRVAQCFDRLPAIKYYIYDLTFYESLRCQLIRLIMPDRLARGCLTNGSI